jgi:hypothetical protein
MISANRLLRFWRWLGEMSWDEVSEVSWEVIFVAIDGACPIDETPLSNDGAHHH